MNFFSFFLTISFSFSFAMMVPYKPEVLGDFMSSWRDTLRNIQSSVGDDSLRKFGYCIDCFRNWNKIDWKENILENKNGLKSFSLLIPAAWLLRLYDVQCTWSWKRVSYAIRFVRETGFLLALRALRVTKRLSSAETLNNSRD